MANNAEETMTEIVISEPEPDTAGQKPNDQEAESKEALKREAERKEALKQYLEALDSCTNNQEGFDVYQMLAFRKMEARRIDKTRIKHPDYKKKKNRLSEYHESVITVIIIGLLQTFGITLILMEVMAVYFFPDAYDVAEEDRSDFECEIGAGHWDNASEVLYKLLAFLFATMISINLGKAIHTIETNGFNMVLSEDFGLKDEHLKLGQIAQVADVTMIQTGIVINMYALFLAVFGSFFLIYASEDGADSLDMVFNSLALFFLIELDDLLVQDNDYQDVQDYVRKKLQKLNQKAGAVQLGRIQEEAEAKAAAPGHSSQDSRSFYKQQKEDIEEEELDIEEAGLKCCSFPCSIRCFRRYEDCSDAIQMVVVIIVYVAAIIGPFAVSLCW